MVIITLHDNLKNQSVVLSNQEITIIGRGFFECQDKRVSKRHGEITVVDTTIRIKSCHNNPIFYTLKNDSGKKVLSKDCEVVLGDSDKFSLLPEEFEWTIKVNQDNEPSSTFRIRQTEEINANLTQLLKEGNETPQSTERTPSPENLRPPIGLDGDLQTTSSTVVTSSRKRSCDSSDSSESGGAKKVKKNSLQVPLSITSDNALHQASSASDNTVPMTYIKPDPDSTEPEQSQNVSNNQNLPSECSTKTEPIDSTNQPSSSTSSTSELKTDQIAVKTEKSDEPSCQTSSNLRPSCEFGIRCYRMTDDHRREYAHPMDCDYRRPIFPPAPFNAPRCPYWDACYRRNPEHFREMAHPPSDQYVTQRPATIQIQIQPSAQPQANQQNLNRNRNGRRNYNDDDGFDDDIYDDDDEDEFGDDSDLDEDYIVRDSQSVSEEDFDDEENNLEE